MGLVYKINELLCPKWIKYLKSDEGRASVLLEDSGSGVNINLSQGQKGIFFKLEECSDFKIFKRKLPCCDFMSIVDTGNSSYAMFFEMKHGGSAQRQLEFSKKYIDFIKSVVECSNETQQEIKESYCYKVRNTKNIRVRTGTKFYNEETKTVCGEKITYRTIPSGSKYQISNLIG